MAREELKQQIKEKQGEIWFWWEKFNLKAILLELSLAIYKYKKYDR